ncbi:MAG: hypothetical protein IJW99_10645 [Clostridia bacterium]|nr:hypothetical protein [Clostridia bacterium]
MKIQVNTKKKQGKYIDPTKWQNSTLRYAPPEDFPAYLEGQLGRAEIMRVWITLDEYWDYRTDTFYPDYDIGVARYRPEELHYVYDWGNIVPAPSGTRFHAYLTSHAAAADELLLNVRRLEREVSDGVITYEQYERIFEKAVEYCKELAPNIRYIECCNEVDIKSFGLLTAEEYVKIYLCAHRAVKRLNEKHHYALPLEIGGFAEAHPLHCWELMRDVMRRLKETEIGNCPMDFYSYHYYQTGATTGLVRCGKLAEAALSGVEMLRLIRAQHDQMLTDLDLPDRPVFLNELGKAKTTGVDGDALYNASGLITYLLAFGCEESPKLYPFPWCTFHNPKLQISYTQFLLCADGSYAMTPNGIAVKMLHDLYGERLACTVSESYARDTDYQAVAVENTDGIAVLVANPSGETVPCELTLSGMASGTYHIVGHLCDSYHNNCVTSDKCDGKTVEITGQADRTVDADGIFRHVFALEKDAFILYKIQKRA